MPTFPSQNPEVEFAKRILNSLFQARKRLARIEGVDSVERALDAIEDAFRDNYVHPGIGFEMIDPTGQKYNDSRNDVQASLSGNSNSNLRVVETMKPIISIKNTHSDGRSTSLIIQQGIVVVRSADEGTNSINKEIKDV